MMQPTPHLLDKRSPKGMEIYQLTGEPTIPSAHVYMEAQIFTPDSKRFVLHRSAHAHGSDPHDPEHRYLLCDLENNGRLTPLTEETGATAPSVTPDGKHLYYFANETEVGGGRLILKRVNLDGTDRQTILAVDAPLPGTRFRPSRIPPLSTISSDGKRLALPAFLGDGRTEDPPWGLMVFDLEKARVALILHGTTWGNLHPQYSRSHDPERAHDLLIQEDHGNRYAPDGQVLQRHAAAIDQDPRRCEEADVLGLAPAQSYSGLAADIHVIRDDGTNLRTMPWGRDGNEKCQGHQCWRGRNEWAITSTMTHRPNSYSLIESLAVPVAGHAGARAPGGIRNVLSREICQPWFYHFATDIEGHRFISDAMPPGQPAEIHFGALGEPGRDPLRLRRVLTARGPVRKETQMHPFLSPDGKLGFFNSDESGILQAYLIKGLDALPLNHDAFVRVVRQALRSAPVVEVLAAKPNRYVIPTFLRSNRNGRVTPKKSRN
ncbi:MAG: PD40 domain-containing protein [Verrucomicrobia bacterium]|nr:PD40 domain-containing protein [Verrucomicrobiota bacterium]